MIDRENHRILERFFARAARIEQLGSEKIQRYSKRRAGELEVDVDLTMDKLRKKFPHMERDVKELV